MMAAFALLLSLLRLTDFVTGFSTKMTAPVIALNVRCKVKPELREEWLTAIREDQRSSRRDEPGVLQFVIGQDVDDQNTFYVHEEYTNISALKNHLNTAHFVKYNDFVQSKQPLEGMDVCFFHPREENEDSLTKKRPVHKDSFALNVNLYPKSNVRQEFLKVISNNKKGTDETEVLALQYTYGESIGIDVKAEGSEMTATIVEGSANTFHFHEQYTGENNGKEGFDAHATMPHFAAWEEFVGTDPFEKDPEVFFFKILE